MTAPVRCKHCGAPIGAVGYWSNSVPHKLLGHLLDLSKDATINSAILRILTRHFGQTVSTERIIEACYGRRQPPLTVENTIRVRISQLRHVVAPLELVIVNERFPSSYRLDHAP